MYSLCLDCGATNVRAMVVDEQGVIVGKASQPNATLPGEENPEFHVWDADRIFRQLSECAVKALEGLNAEQVTAVTITTSAWTARWWMTPATCSILSYPGNAPARRRS